MKKMMNLIMLSCKKTTELIEKRFVTKLSVVEKIQLSMHTAMCKTCKMYEKQSDIIEKSLEKIQQKECEPMKLSSEKKEEILNNLN